MRELLKIAVLLSLALAPACRNEQASSSNSNSDAAKSVTSSAPAIVLAGRVTDAAEVLTPEQEATLNTKLAQLEQATKHQMVVVTVPTLGGADIDTFTKDLGNSWGIGREDYNDGVIILIAPNERRVRIAVGYGLEKLLTHDVCKQIIDKQMMPRFRKHDLAGGIDAGADALIERMS